jgi:hypothetical protein
LDDIMRFCQAYDALRKDFIEQAKKSLLSIHSGGYAANA